MGKKNSGEVVVIEAPKIKKAVFYIRGTAPYVQNAFPAKALEEMKQKQESGEVAKKNKKRAPKDFKKCFEAAKHISTDGWCGIPAAAMRAAMISACRVAGFVMTKAKLSVFVEADGYDKSDNTALIKITKGKPKYVEHHVRNETGVIDIRPRPMWDPGWEATVTIRYDADQFCLQDVANLLMRVGMQVGIGEGRPDSKKSCGMGWGLFEMIGKEVVSANQ